MASQEEMKKRFLQKMQKEFKESMEELVSSIPENKRPPLAETQNFTEKMLQSMNVLEQDIAVDGDRRFLPAFPPETAKAGYDVWQPNDGTVLICTAGKTGTTWVMEIVRQLMFRKDEHMDKLSRILTKAPYHYIEDGPPEKYEFLSRLSMKRRVLATHLPPDLVNVKKLKENGAKMVYVSRNPKDTTVSLFTFLSKMPFSDAARANFPDDFDEFAEAFMHGKIPLVGLKEGEWYPHHIRYWMKYKDDESFLFIRYEDLKKDPLKEIRKIADFIGCHATNDDVKEVAISTDFDAMREAEEKRLGKNTVKMNKGKVGNWRHKFSEELSERMDKAMKRDLQGADIEFVYDL